MNFEMKDDEEGIVIAASTGSLTEEVTKEELTGRGQPKKGKSQPKKGIDDLEKDLEWTEPVRNHESIINKEGENSLMMAALDLMNSSNATTDSIKAKKISLDLVQISIAELQAYRIARFATTAIILEERMYSPENLKELKKASQIQESLNQLNSSMKDALNYIQSTTSKVKFDSIESYLQDIVDGQPSEGKKGPNEFTKVARGVLDKISGGEGFDEILSGMAMDEEEMEDLEDPEDDIQSQIL